MTQRVAASAFNVPRSTIKNKLNGKHNKTVSRSRVFIDNEEISFEHHLIKLAEYGFPVSLEVGLDEINSYMNNLSVTIKDTPPSRVWNYDETNLSDDPGNKKGHI